MEIIIELFFRRLIQHFIGLYSRYLFFKIIGKNKTLDELTTNNKSANYSQSFYNLIIGLIVFILLSVCIAYIVYS